MPRDSAIRCSVFAARDDDIISLTGVDDKRRGRPRSTWATEVKKMAEKVANSVPLHTKIAEKESWEMAVKKFCSAT